MDHLTMVTTANAGAPQQLLSGLDRPISPQRLARLIRVPPKWVYLDIHAGRFPEGSLLRIGRAIRISPPAAIWYAGWVRKDEQPERYIDREPISRQDLEVLELPITVRGLMNLTGLGKTAIYKHIKTGVIPRRGCFHVDKMVLVRAAAAREYVREVDAMRASGWSSRR